MRLFPVSEQPDSDHWYTPAWIFEGLDLEFDLDVAAPAEPIAWLPARRRFTLADDGLAQPWSGLVWCNPPYSDPGEWCRRWAEHPDGCLLIRSDFSSVAGLVAVAAADGLYVPAGRIRFYCPGDPPRRNHSNFTTVMLARGARCVSAIDRLAHLYGGVARRLNNVG